MVQSGGLDGCLINGIAREMSSYIHTLIEDAQRPVGV